MQITVQYNQSLQDIALQEYGDISGVLILATDNNLSVTDTLAIRQTLTIDENKIIDKKTVLGYKNNNKILATASVAAVPIVVIPPTLDETGLIFDFDFEKQDKMVLSNKILIGEYPTVKSYEDRGVVLEQNGWSLFRPALAPEGLYFDGIDDFMQIIGIQPQEIWLVCNSPKLAFDVNGETLFEDGTGYVCIGRDANVGSISGISRINNVSTFDFAPLSQYKTVSDIIAGYENLFIAGPNGNANFNGHIKRILLFDVARTETQRTELQAYLAQKYSL